MRNAGKLKEMEKNAPKCRILYIASGLSGLASLCGFGPILAERYMTETQKVASGVKFRHC